MGKEYVGVAVGVFCEGCGLGAIDMMLFAWSRWERVMETRF